MHTLTHHHFASSLGPSLGVQVVQGQVSQSVWGHHHGAGGDPLCVDVPSGGLLSLHPSRSSDAALFLLLHPHTLVHTVLLLLRLPLALPPLSLLIIRESEWNMMGWW